jgi:hypothetical protein
MSITVQSPQLPPHWQQVHSENDKLVSSAPPPVSPVFPATYPSGCRDKPRRVQLGGPDSVGCVHTAGPITRPVSVSARVNDIAEATEAEQVETEEKGLCVTKKSVYVHTAGKFWHKRCFNCEGCSKNIGDIPMVDLLGGPSCVKCFDECLKRDSDTPNKKWNSNGASLQIDKTNNMSTTRISLPLKHSIAGGSPLTSSSASRYSTSFKRATISNPVLEQV